MGLFNKIFGDSEHKDTRESSVKWKLLSELDQLDAIEQTSHTTPVVIFKHSTRCNISRMALKQFENHYSISQEDAEPYFLDLLEYRPVSNAVADKFNVVHQSPQLLLINNGVCVYTASHSDIDAEDLAKKVAEL